MKIIRIAKLHIIWVILLMSLAWCGVEVTQVSNTIEAGSDVLDPIKFIEIEKADQYEVLVTENNIDTSKLGSYTVKYEFKDKNSSKIYNKEFRFDVVDTTSPEIIFTVGKEIKIEKGNLFQPLDYIEIKDNYDQVLSKESVNIENTVDTNKIGTYYVKYSVSDSNGNNASASLPVEIIKPIGKIGQTESLNKYDITVNSYKFNRTDSEPATYFYQYYTAEDGETFLICNVTIKNNDNIEVRPFDIFGNESQMIRARLKYDDKYIYDDTPHSLENNWYYTFCSINPLTTKVRNLSFEIPTEVSNSGKSIVLEFYSYSDESENVYIRLQ